MRVGRRSEEGARRDRWEGSDAPSGGRVVSLRDKVERSGPATDYDSACEAARFVGLVRARDFVALAIVRGPIAWLPLPEGGVLAHWEYGETKEEAAALLRAALTTSRGHGDAPFCWKRTPSRLPVPSGKLIVFDAAHRAKHLTPAKRLLLSVSPGINAVDESTFEPNESTAMTLYRFSAAGRRQR